MWHTNVWTPPPLAPLAPLPLLHPLPGLAQRPRNLKREYTSGPPPPCLLIIRRRIPGYFFVTLVPPALLVARLTRRFSCCPSTWTAGVPQNEDEGAPEGGGEGDAECTNPVDAYEQVMTPRDTYTFLLSPGIRPTVSSSLTVCTSSILWSCRLRCRALFCTSLPHSWLHTTSGYLFMLLQTKVVRVFTEGIVSSSLCCK